MPAKLPTYASLTDSGRFCSDVCDALIQRTGRKWCFDPFNGASHTERPDGSAVLVTVHDEQPGEWTVEVIDGNGHPLNDPAPVCVHVRESANPNTVAQALAPHVLAFVTQ